MAHTKHPGGRPAVWGQRQAMTIRVPLVIKRVLSDAASRNGEPFAVYCVRVLSADCGVQLDPRADQLVLMHDPHTSPAGDHAMALRPASWDDRLAMNIRPTVPLRAALIEGANRLGIPLAEYCVIRLAARHGFELNPSTQRDQLPVAVGA